MHRRVSPYVGSFMLLLASAVAAVWLTSRNDTGLERVKAVRRQNVSAIPDRIADYDRQPVSAASAPWVIFHGMLGHGGEFRLDRPSGGQVSCLEWTLCELTRGGTYKGISILAKAPWGYSFTHGPTPALQMEFEDHYCQFLYIMLACGIDPDSTRICVPGGAGNISIRTLVKSEQSRCDRTIDVSWAIPVFIRWGGSSTWGNRFGETFDIDGLVRQHLRHESACVACFGTHWRLGLAIAVRDARDRLTRDTRRRADLRLQELIKEARDSMSSSGQFRLEWGVFPAMPQGATATTLPPLPTDSGALLSHQGHMVEWLMVALSDDQLLREEWPHRAVQRLLNELPQIAATMNYGGYSHCIHALRLYQQRMATLET